MVVGPFAPSGLGLGPSPVSAADYADIRRSMCSMTSRGEHSGPSTLVADLQPGSRLTRGDVCNDDGTFGLTSAEAVSRLEQHGRNEISEPPSPGVLTRAADQLRDPMILLLLGAAAVTVALRDVVDTVVIGLVVVLNTTVGVVQEIRAERTVRALRRLAAPNARVIRGGSHLVIPAAELVPGDLVQLDTGDIVPADASLLEATALQVDESALTGEAVPVEKDVHPEPDDCLPPRDGSGIVHAGTVVTKGR